jgi:hypothetical protein
MRKVILLPILLHLMIISLTYAYNPPVYIANPDTGECKYYFAGDAKHFNPRPENFTVTIGVVTEFENVNHSCDYWKCSLINGYLNEDKECICPSGSIMVNGKCETNEDKCRNTRGVWAAGTCTCTSGTWSDEKGCVDVNGRPIDRFDGGGFVATIWVLIILGIVYFVFRGKIIDMIKGVKGMKHEQDDKPSNDEVAPESKDSENVEEGEKDGNHEEK